MASLKIFTRDDYLGGHQHTYPAAYTPEIEREADESVRIANIVHQRYFAATGDAVSKFNSGWRPEPYNTQVGGAKGSRHTEAKAWDSSDKGEGLDNWLKHTPEGKATMEEFDLYGEEPAYTFGWSHLQRVPYRNYKPGMPRWFKP